MDLPGARVELIERKESCYAIVSWGGLTRFLPMTHATYGCYAAVVREFEEEAAIEQRSADRTRAGRAAKRALSAAAGAGSGGFTGGL
jgi:hypothetical protein